MMAVNASKRTSRTCNDAGNGIEIAWNMKNLWLKFHAPGGALA
jgi:hypothetical protein